MTDISPDQTAPRIETASVYEENGTIYYRASALGGCLSCLVANRLGYSPQKPPEWLIKRFDESAAMEGPVVAAVAAERDSFIQTQTDTGQQIQVRMEGGVTSDGKPIVIVGHIDGMYVLGSKETDVDTLKEGITGLEVKAFRKDYWKKWKKKGIGGFPLYVTQTSIYMHATGWPFDFAVALKNDEGGIDDLDIDTLNEPILSEEEIWGIIVEVERLAQENTIPIAPVTITCTHPQFHTADDMELMDGDGLEDSVKEQLVKLGLEYNNAKTLADQYDKLRKGIAKQIIELFDSVDREQYEDFKVKINKVDSHSTWYDIDKMRADGIPVDDYEKQTPYSYVTAKDKIYGRQAGGS